MMSGNVHPNPCPVFPCLVCAGNVTWRGRSVQCCICSNWVHLKCSLLSFYRFRTLGSSHSWSYPPCFFWRSHTYRHCDFVLRLLQLVYLHCSNLAHLAPVLMQHSYPTLAFKPSILFPHTLYLLSLHPYHRLMLLAISSYLVHLICIQESNLNLSSSFRIPEFCALRSDDTHSRSGIFSTDVTDASGRVIIFVRQGFSFSELSSLDPYSDYVEVNISLNNSSSLSFLNVYAPPIRSFPKDSRTDFFSLTIFPSYLEAEAVEFLRFRFQLPASDSSSTSLRQSRLK